MILSENLIYRRMILLMKRLTFYTVNFLVLILAINSLVLPETETKADPNYISSGLSCTNEGIPSIKVGDILYFKRFIIGGMIEARNEKRFNQQLLPNHNWRGVGKIDVSLKKFNIKSSLLSTSVSLCHESAHPTMGVKEPTTKAYELIYDDVYRRMILNSIGISGHFSNTGNKNTFSSRADYNFYFLSKNTPELPGSKLDFSSGFSAGAENKYRFANNLNFNVSIFDRLIFKSNAADRGYVYKGNGESLVDTLTLYPVISEINTIVLKSGLSISFNGSRREAGVYIKLLYGNPYGFIDSRDKRFVSSIGIETYM
jgi:hypothetical protein